MPTSPKKSLLKPVAKLDEDAQVVPIDSVRQHPKNARRSDMESIKESIRENGFYGALVVQRSTNLILVHNHAWQAARELGHKTIPVRFYDCDDETAERIVLVDNRTSDRGTYDDRLLASALKSLAETPKGLAGTGYSPSDLAVLERALVPAVPPVDFPKFDEGAGSSLVHKCPKCGFRFGAPGSGSKHPGPIQ